MEIKDLLYYNGFGGFSKNGKEYVIRTNEKYTPAPWSHMIANENFGTIITSGGGGYTWSNNSRDNKITTWTNDPVRDKPSEKIYIKDSEEKTVYAMPYENLEGYEMHYGFGYAKINYSNDRIKQELLIYVPLHENKKIQKLTIMNLKNGEVTCDVFFEIEPVLGVSKEYTKKHIVIETVQKGVKIKNYYRDIYQNQIVKILANVDVSNTVTKDKNIILSSKVTLKANEKKEVIFELQVLDEENGEEKVSSSEDIEKDLRNIEEFWNELLGKIKIKTPVESMNIVLNGWLGYQTLVSRLWGRTSFYQAGGAFGFRDQLQDSLMMLYLNPSITRKQILYHAAHQFKEGDVLHWWHPEKSNGIRTRYTDDLLWLPYLICEYVEKESDVLILDEEISYVETEVLRDSEGERYGEVSRTNEKESLYMHAIRAIEKSLNFAENGLPHMGTGDWNDGMNNIKGQSVWLGFFMYDVINKFCKICEYKNDSEREAKYKKIICDLKSTLNNFAWDGNWYRRAYFEDGKPLGSSENDECKIDGISQSWAVISGAGEYEKCVAAMNSLENYLVDKENMLIKLLTPAFSKTALEPGYIKSYIPGVRENGGQYTHGAVWSIIANAILGDTNRAAEYFRIINPIEHARTKESALKYKVEPYVVAADVYSNINMLGRGGWTWYTGSSSWLYIAGLEYVLGIKKEGDFLKINPCIPKEWETYSVIYKYKNADYTVKVYNTSQKGKEIKTIYLNNDEIKTNKIKLESEGIHTIDVIL